MIIMLSLMVLIFMVQTGCSVVVIWNDWYGYKSTKRLVSSEYQKIAGVMV